MIVNKISGIGNMDMPDICDCVICSMEIIDRCELSMDFNDVDIVQEVCDCIKCMDLVTESQEFGSKRTCNCYTCTSYFSAWYTKNRHYYDCNGYAVSEPPVFDRCDCDICVPAKRQLSVKGDETKYVMDTCDCKLCVGKSDLVDEVSEPLDKCDCEICMDQQWVNDLDTKFQLQSDESLSDECHLDSGKQTVHNSGITLDPGKKVFKATNQQVDIHQDGGFRIKQNGQETWVENVIQDRVSGPFSQIEHFYIVAHDAVKNSGVPNFKGARIPIPTKLNIPYWYDCLGDYQDRVIVDLLKFGFPLGYISDSLPVSELRNHSGATDFGQYVSSYLEKEIDRKLILGPWSFNPLESPLTLSPLNTVPKKVPGERRVISDFSYPAGTSVNDGIRKDWYLDECISLTYPSVESLAEMLQRFGPGCKIFKKDLKRAYRQFGLDPGDINFAGYFWKNSLYVDTALVMGSRSAAFLCQRVTNAVSYLAQKQGIVVLNYLDDLCSVSNEEDSVPNFDKITVLLKELGLEEAQDKSVRPGTRVEFLGVLFDTVSQTMEVTGERLSEISDLISEWLSKVKSTKRELQSLIGKLVFICKCVFSSRIFICRMLDTLRTLRAQHHRFRITQEFRKDLLWWFKFLKVYNGTTYIPEMSWKKPDVLLSTDACLTGCGGWCSGEFFSTGFPPEVVAKNFHINILELLTILVSLRLWSYRFSGLRIKLYCDNEVSVCVLNSGKSRDKVLLQVLREIVFICACSNIQLQAVHLPGVENRIADRLSRAHLENVNLREVMGPDSTRLDTDPTLFEIGESW